MYKNHYGSDYTAALYCGLNLPPRPARGLWQHGWVQKACVHIPEQLFGTTLPNPRAPLFVASEWARDLLMEHGHTNVHAIGLPMSYTKSLHIAQRKNSLLVMPAHSIEGMAISKLPTNEYAHYIQSVSHNFSEVTVCLYHHDFKRSIWRNAFETLGFKCVMGADHMSAGALQDQRNLLRRYEFMTTNGEGSHIAYAAAAGLKVSLSGPIVCWKSENLRQLPFYRSHPEALFTWEHNDENSLRKRMGWLMTEPHLAEKAVEWGREQIGCHHRRSPRQLRKLFGWTPSVTMLCYLRAAIPLPSSLSTLIDKYVY